MQGFPARQLPEQWVTGRGALDLPPRWALTVEVSGEISPIRRRFSATGGVRREVHMVRFGGVRFIRAKHAGYRSLQYVR